MEATKLFTDTESMLIGIITIILLIALLVLRIQGSKKMRK